MALKNAFGDLNLEATQQQIKELLGSIDTTTITQETIQGLMQALLESIDQRLEALESTVKAEGDNHDLEDSSLRRGLYTLGLRNDNNTPLTGSDREYSSLSVDSAGAIKVVSGATKLNVDDSVTQGLITQLDTNIGSNLTNLGTTINANIDELDTNIGSNLTNLGTTINANIDELDTNIANNLVNLDTSINTGLSNLDTSINSGLTNVDTSVNNLRLVNLDILGQFNSEFSRIKEKRYKDTEEVRYDIPTTALLANNSIYTGVAPDGALTSDPVWTVLRVYFNADRLPVRERIRSGVVWDDRTLGW